MDQNEAITRPRRTPLYNFHQRHGARFVEFSGWEMPVQYGGILQEHRTVRSAAGLFDVSHMGEIFVRGNRAGEFLDHTLTNRIATQPNGKATYSPMCMENGGAIDDVLAYKRSADDFLLCVNAANTAKDLKWLSEHAPGSGCEVSDASDNYALLALQGPKAAGILEKLTDFDIGLLRYYSFADGKVAGSPAMISRTGYTGEDGFELFLPPELAEDVAEAIMDAGTPEGLTPAGLGARDSLRLEACFPLHGHELSEFISPIQAGLGWTVRFEKTDFIGRNALFDQKINGVIQSVVFFRTHSRRIARPGMTVFAIDESQHSKAGPGIEAGLVLSGAMSPLFNESIGSALVNRTLLERELSVDFRGTRQRIEIVKPPFYRRS